LLARRLTDLREAICDDYALEDACDRLAYCELLVETADRLCDVRTMAVAVGLLDSARAGLEERITRLLAKEKQSMAKLTLGAKFVAAATLALACLTIAAATAYSQAPPAQKKVLIKVIVDGKELDLTDDIVQALLAKKAKLRDEADAQQDMLTATAAVKLALDQAARQGAKSDPRIEQLVEQAEKLKPGSGAAVRQALQHSQEDAQRKRAEAIEALVKQAEAITPGSGAKIRFYLQSGGVKKPAPVQPGDKPLPVPPVLPGALDPNTSKGLQELGKYVEHLTAASKLQEKAAFEAYLKSTAPTMHEKVASSAGSGVQGKIEKMDGDLVIINIGTDNGVKNDQTLKIYRTKPEPKYLGLIRIVDVQVRQSVCRLLFKGDPGIQIGDTVIMKQTEEHK
jgi:hypothetical protein